MHTIGSPDDASAQVSDAHGEVLRLFQAHGAGLYRFCRSMTGSRAEAEDVVQETFVKLLQHLQAGRDRSNLRAWLFTVAANACRTHVRWRVRWLPWDASRDTRSVGSDPPERDVAAVYEALQRLSTRDRLLLSLRAQGLSYKEIAAAARIGESSVGRLLARAAARCRRHLAGT